MVRALAVMTVLAVATAVSAADEPRAPVMGNITALNEPGTISVQIDIGRDQGLKLFDSCDVYQEKEQIGRLRITEVEKLEATAEIVELHPAKKLLTGDRVIVDITLQFLKNLRPKAAIEAPAELGRRHALTDIRSDLKRILHYGEPWSQGKPLIDEDTGYPVTVAAGCVVTRDFVAFVEQYNATVQEHFRKDR